MQEVEVESLNSVCFSTVKTDPGRALGFFFHTPVASLEGAVLLQVPSEATHFHSRPLENVKSPFS